MTAYAPDRTKHDAPQPGDIKKPAGVQPETLTGTKPATLLPVVFANGRTVHSHPGGGYHEIIRQA